MKKLFIELLLSVLSLGTVTQGVYALPQQTTQHLKKDGTPDKRYKENKVHLKKDGLQTSVSRKIRRNPN